MRQRRAAIRASAGIMTLHTPKIEVLAEHLPIRIEFVDTPEKVDEVLPALCEMLTDGMIEVQDTTVVKLARRGAKATETVERSGPVTPANEWCCHRRWSTPE